ncbi:MFS transporter [Oryzihumus sp.]|uniref:MFS transporter n=1 Tax=Oryzihumus sp. TaxID=1968903 RepID=UPI002EDB6681
MSAHASSRRVAPTPLVVAVLSLCGTIVALQQTLVVPLLPEFPKLLHTTTEDASWLVTATLLTSAVATPIVSRLADMAGKRLMMIICLVVMIAGSVVGALGTSLGAVVTGRALQGFAAALIPVGISIMRDELPRERVGSAVALMSATLGIGAAIGLPLSGFISEHADWHALFWVAAGMGALMLVAVPLVIPESPVRTRGRFDVGGAILLSTALTSLLLAISKGGHWGWTSERTLVLFVAAAVLLAVWLPVELRVAQPLVDVRTSARPAVLLTNLASVLLGFAMFGNMLTTTQLLQMPKATGYGFGLSVIDAGLGMLPAGLAMVLLAPVSAAITRRFGARTTLITGALIMAGAYVGRVFLVGQLWQVIVGAALVSMGTAVSYAAMPTLIMRAVPITETASANGLNTLLRAIGTSTASATVAAVLTGTVIRLGPVAVPALDAFKHIFWLAAIASLASAAVALALPRSRAAAPAPALAPGTGEAVTPAPETRVHDEVKGPGREHEIVVRGVVHAGSGRPIRGAVVSVLRIDGEPVDWSRVDSTGAYQVALPGPGRYLVVTAADGWSPRSDVLDLGEGTTHQHLVLTERLSLTGQVRGAQGSAEGALVTLTKPSGESVTCTRADAEGRYALPLPGAGRYVLTVVDAAQDRATSTLVTVTGHSETVDVDLPAPTRVLA